MSRIMWVHLSVCMLFYAGAIWSISSQRRQELQEISNNQGGWVALEKGLNECALDTVGVILGSTFGFAAAGAALSALPDLFAIARTSGGWGRLGDLVESKLPGTSSVAHAPESGGEFSLTFDAEAEGAEQGGYTKFGQLHQEFAPGRVAPEPVTSPVAAELQAAEDTGALATRPRASSSAGRLQTGGQVGQESPTLSRALATASEETALVARTTAAKAIEGDIKEALINSVMTKLEGQVNYKNGLSQAVNSQTKVSIELVKDARVSPKLVAGDVQGLKQLRNAAREANGTGYPVGLVELTDENIESMVSAAQGYRAQFQTAVRNGVNTSVDEFIAQEQNIFAGAGRAAGAVQVTPQDQAYNALLSVLQEGQGTPAQQQAVFSLQKRLYTDLSRELRQLPGTQQGGEWSRLILGGEAQNSNMYQIMRAASANLQGNVSITGAQKVLGGGGTLEQVLPAAGTGSGVGEIEQAAPGAAKGSASQILPADFKFSSAGKPVVSEPAVPSTSIMPEPQQPLTPVKSPQTGYSQTNLPPSSRQLTPKQAQSISQFIDQETQGFIKQDSFLSSFGKWGARIMPPSSRALKAAGITGGTVIGLAAGLGVGLSQMGACYHETISLLHYNIDPKDFGTSGCHAYLSIENQTDFPLTVNLTRQAQGNWAERKLNPVENNRLLPLEFAILQEIVVRMPGKSEIAPIRFVTDGYVNRIPALNEVMHATITYRTDTNRLYVSQLKGLQVVS